MTISYSGSFLKLIFRWKGSIWKAVIWELVFFLFFYYHIRLISPIFFEWIDPDDSEGYKAIYKTMCVEFYEYSKLIPITFILGFYVSNIVTRWWSQFQSLKWPEDFLSTLCMLLPKHESKQTRHQIARYMNLTAALAWRDISVQIRSRFPTVRKIIDSGLMTETEFEMLEAVNDPSPGIRWLTPLHWVQQLIMKEVDAGRANAAFTVVTMNELKAYRESFRKLYCHDWVNVPLLYTQVAAIATYSYFFFCLFGRQDVKSVEPQHSLDHYFPLFTVVQFIFFVGWFKVGQDLIAPFGNDDDDFELSYILDRNIITSFTVVDSLQDGESPGFEEDVFWNYYTTEHQIQNKIPTAMKWGRIDMSQNAHRRPPKLHARLRDEEDPNQGKYIAW